MTPGRPYYPSDTSHLFKWGAHNVTLRNIEYFLLFSGLWTTVAMGLERMLVGLGKVSPKSNTMLWVNLGAVLTAFAVLIAIPLSLP